MEAADFDHHRDTHWDLTGRHIKVDCHTCHTASVAMQKLPTDCANCHRASDVHAGELGTRCDQCHTTEGWRAGVSFDHDLTANIPLLGLHVAVSCEQCHTTRKYRDAGLECIDCHKKDDVHKGSLGVACAKCHSPNGWRPCGNSTTARRRDSHSPALTRSSFARAASKQPADEVKLNLTCLSCHEQDDVHLGQYGRQCQRCHSTITFKGASLH